MRIAIIGKGNVGTALETGFKRLGLDVQTVGKDPAKVKQVGGWGELLVLAVPYPAIDETLKELGDTVDRKPLIDVTNALSADHKLAIGITSSAAEELQRKVPKARVVKAFNTMFAKHMAFGRAHDQQNLAVRGGR